MYHRYNNNIQSDISQVFSIFGNFIFLFNKFIKLDLEIINFNQFTFRVQIIYVNILKVIFFFISVEYFYSNVYIVDLNAFKNLFWLIIVLTYVNIPTGNT